MRIILLLAIFVGCAGCGGSNSDKKFDRACLSFLETVVTGQERFIETNSESDILKLDESAYSTEAKLRLLLEDLPNPTTDREQKVQKLLAEIPDEWKAVALGVTKYRELHEAGEVEEASKQAKHVGELLANIEKSKSDARQVLFSR